MTKYTKQEWVDEVLAGSERFEVLDNAGNPVDDLTELAECQIALKTTVTTPGTPVNAENMNNIEELLDRSYHYVQTLYITTTQDFEKADYPWLRAIKVYVQGGGGGGKGGSGGTPSGGGGGAGGLGVGLITDIASLGATVAMTIGIAGRRGWGDTSAGVDGGDSSFGTLVTGLGGKGAPASLYGGAGGGGTGDLVYYGGSGEAGGNTGVGSGNGADSLLGGGGLGIPNTTASAAGQHATGKGAGGGGARTNAGGQDAGDGTAGLIIVELYA